MLLALIALANLVLVAVLLALLVRAYILIHRLEGELGLEACRTRELEVELRKLTRDRTSA